MANLTAATLIIDAVEQERFDIAGNGAAPHSKKARATARCAAIPGNHYDFYKDPWFEVGPADTLGKLSFPIDSIACT